MQICILDDAKTRTLCGAYVVGTVTEYDKRGYAAEFIRSDCVRVRIADNPKDANCRFCSCVPLTLRREEVELIESALPDGEAKSELLALIRIAD